MIAILGGLEDDPEKAEEPVNLPCPNYNWGINITPL
jgi:hypothetical protein